jgi:hypothetical protein
MLLIANGLFVGAIFAFLAYCRRKHKIINYLLVGAAGVEPAISVENTQLTDSENASNSSNATIAKSSTQIAYKDFPEPQNFQASPALAQHAAKIAAQGYIR